MLCCRRVLSTISRRSVARIEGRRRLCSSSAANSGSDAAASSSGVVTEVVSTAKERVVSVWEFYTELLTEYPLRTNAVTSGVLCAFGDALAQCAEWKLQIMSPDKEEYNLARTLRMAIFGTFVGGPILATWYRALHTTAESLSISYAPIVQGRLAWLAERTPALSWVTNLRVQSEGVALQPSRVLMGKVFVDSMLFQAPFLNLYFAVMGFLEGLTLSEIYEKTKASFHRAWALSILVWTPVQAVNLALVPVPFQPVVVAGVNVGWKTTLSLLNHYQCAPLPRAARLPPAFPASARKLVWTLADARARALSPTCALCLVPAASTARRGWTLRRRSLLPAARTSTAARRSRLI